MTNSDTDDDGEYGQCKAAHHRREGERCEQPAVGEHGYCASHQHSDPEATKYGRCTATSKSTDKQCGNAAVGSHGKCRFHGGNTPTKAENPAVGAPDGNGRAITHGVYADPLNLYHHLEPRERQWVDSLMQGYVDVLDMDATDPRLERLLRACLHIYQTWSAEDRILEDGLSEETVVGISETSQPIITKSGHHLHEFSLQRDRQAQRILRDLGAFSDDTTGGPIPSEMSSESYKIVSSSDSENSDDADG